MKANEFVKKFGWDRAKREVALIGTIAMMCGDNDFNNDLKRLVESHELVEKVGGLDVCKKIMFQKRLRQPKATHVLQHHENKKLIQFFSTNQSKPNGSVMLDAIEQAIADVESCQ